MENKRLHETNVKNCVRLYYITLNRTKSFWGSQLLLLASTGSQPSPLLPASVGFQSFPSLSAPSVFKLLTTALVEASGGDRLWTPPGCRPQEGCLCFLPLRSCPSLCWFMQKSPVPFCFVSCSPALLSSSKLAPVNSACLPACLQTRSSPPLYSPCAMEIISEVADLRVALVDNLNSSDSDGC